MKLNPRYWLDLALQRKSRGLDLAGSIHFDPAKHPRDHRGRFRKVADEILRTMDGADAGNRFDPETYDLPGGYSAHPRFVPFENPSWDVYDPKGRTIAEELSPLEVGERVADDMEHKVNEFPELNDLADGPTPIDIGQRVRLPDYEGTHQVREAEVVDVEPTRVKVRYVVPGPQGGGGGNEIRSSWIARQDVTPIPHTVEPSKPIRYSDE